MDSSVPDPQQQPPQAERSQPQHPHQIQGSYYHYQYNGSQSGFYENQHSYSFQGDGAAYQQPSCPATVPSHIPRQCGAHVPGGLNQAAAASLAALSELPEFAENMARQEAANAGLTGPGSGVLRYHHPQASHDILARGMNGRGFPRRGRGPRGRGRGRGGNMGRSRGGESTNLTPASETEIFSAKSQATGPAPSRKPVPQIFWCEICMVDCNTLDTLEQHKNGKRHKKTVKKREEMQAWQKLQLGNETKDVENDTSREPQNQSVQVTDYTNKTDIIIPADEEKRNVQGSHHNLQEAIIPAVEEKTNVQDSEQNFQEITLPAIEERKNVQDGQHNVPGETVINRKELDNLLQTQSTDSQSGEMEQKSTSEPPTNPSLIPSHTGRNLKRKMRGSGRGDKRARHLEHSDGKPPEKLREQPVVCTICNITCDTLAVFQTHLDGRKHTTRTKRFQGQQPTSESPGYFHENPGYVHHTSQGPAPIFYGFQPPQASQQYDHMQDAPLEFRTGGEAQCEQAVEAVTEAADLVNPEGLNAVPDSDIEKVEPAEQKSGFEGDKTKLDNTRSDASTAEGSVSSNPSGGDCF